MTKRETLSMIGIQEQPLLGLFENIIIKRQIYNGDWYIECLSEVGITYGIGECFGVSVSAQYPTDIWADQNTTWLTHCEDRQWWQDDLPVGKVIKPFRRQDSVRV